MTEARGKIQKYYTFIEKEHDYREALTEAVNATN